jgi:CRP-like cAMP-binding protein
MAQVVNVRPAPARVKSRLFDFVTANQAQLPERHFARGEFLMTQGRRGNGDVLVITSGKVDVFVEDCTLGGAGERTKVKVTRRLPGEFVGLTAAAARPSWDSKLRRESVHSVLERTHSESRSFRSVSETSQSSMTSSAMSRRNSGGGGSGGGGGGGGGELRRSSSKQDLAVADAVAVTAVECLVLDRQTMDWALTRSSDAAELRREIERDVQNRTAQLQAATLHSGSGWRSTPSGVLHVSDTRGLRFDADRDDILAVDESQIALQL